MNEYQHFNTTLELAREALERDGVAVISAVVAEQMVTASRDNLWESFEFVTDWKLNRNDPSTFKHFLDLMPMHSMLVQHFGVGHSQAAWNIREATADTFAALWGEKVENMITSFDGVSLHLPPEETKRGFFRNVWMHTDQRSSRSGLESFQGLVNLYDVRPGDATLRVYKGSHQFHGEFFRTFGIDTKSSDWYKLETEEHHRFFAERGCEAARVLANAGDLVLWDSRTMHCGVESLRERAEPNYRAVVYCCMTPRSKATQKIQQRRNKMFDEGRMSTHLPHGPRMFGKNPRTYGRPVPLVKKVPRAILSEKMKRWI